MCRNYPKNNFVINFVIIIFVSNESYFDIQLERVLVDAS
jgi:hypothetical protein